VFGKKKTISAVKAGRDKKLLVMEVKHKGDLTSKKPERLI